MAKENNKKKKDAYPSKKTLNLYFKDDKTSKPSTIMLYCLFALVVLLASAKLFVYDVIVDVDEQKSIYTQNEKILQQYLDKLAGYGDLKDQYNKYSFDYLHEDEILCSRIDVLDMLEETIAKEASITRIYLDDNKVKIEFEGADLEKTAVLSQRIEAYDFVNSVAITKAGLSSKNGVYEVEMELILSTETKDEGGKK